MHYPALTMQVTTTSTPIPPGELSPSTRPDHTQLPDSDDNFVKNFQEHPQSVILTTSIEPLLDKIHPDKDYCIGQDSGIYWRFTEPVEKGVEAPDWFYVAGVPSRLEGKLRRSYVMWKEKVPPLIVIEFVSGDGKEEKDNSPPPERDEVDPKTKKAKKAGKFWVYEQAVKIPYYAIFDGFEGTLEMYHLEKGRYEQVKANRRNHYPIPELGVELGMLLDQEKPPVPWLRWWDNRGNLLLTGNERAEEECQRRELAEAIAIQERQQKEIAEALAIQERTEKEQERQQKEMAEALAIQERSEKEQEREKREKLAAYLRSLGINPDEI